MKSFLTAMIAAFAVAEQINDPGITNDAQAGYLDAIMNGMVGNMKAANFGAERGDRADEAAASAMRWMETYEASLPTVCQRGTECRNLIQTTTETEIREQWDKILENIGTIFSGALDRNIATLEDAWTAAAQCAHGCFCPDAWKRYKELIDLQNQVWRDVETLVNTLDEQLNEEERILGGCPAYEYLELEGGELVWVQVPQ